MTIEIKKERLRISALKGNGAITSYAFNFDDLLITDAKLKICLERKVQIFYYLEIAKYNIIDAKTFLNQYLENPHQQAFFISAVIFYSACFNKDNTNTIPMIHVANYNDIKNNQAHKTIIDYRDKLFAHLDKNCSFSEYSLCWGLNKVDNQCYPRKGSLSKTLCFQNISNINEWMEFIDKLIKCIDQDSDEITKQINDLLTTITICN